MDSSDDSFAWSNASKDSDDMAVSINDEAEESGVNHKKALHEKLFNNEQQESIKKSKKRKHEETAAVNESGDEKPKCIKSEPESDFDAPKKKKKKKNNDDLCITESQQYNYSDDSYLNYLVKQEQTSFAEPAPVKSKKKKRHKRDSETVSEELDNQDHDMSTEKNHIEKDGNEEAEIKKKKNKKSKHEADISNEDIDPCDDNFKAKKKLKKKKQEKIINSTSYDKSEVPQMSQIDDLSAIDSSTLVNNYLDDDQIKVNGDVNDMPQELESNKKPNTSSSNNVKRVNKISDRLRFEDEDNVDYIPKEKVDDKKLSKNLKQFIESNSHYSIVNTSAEKETLITPNDEVWIIKGPHDLKAQDFDNKNIKIGAKGKLKLNGQTYDLVSGDITKKAAILMCDKNQIQVPNISINGVIKLYKRVTKPHIPEENVMVNQANFTTLPDVKCRHPLLGGNYEKASKVPTLVAERLDGTVVSSPVDDERVKKKKHKKEKRKLEVESESEMKPFEDETTGIPPKKKRKRKSSIKEEPVTKKAKYENNEDTGDVWESEQAIEKNLFDF